MEMLQYDFVLPFAIIIPISHLSNIVIQIQNFIIRRLVHYNKTLSANKITADSRLFEDGIIDSMSFVELILDIQNEYRIDIDSEEINETNFKSIYHLSNFVENKK